MFDRATYNDVSIDLSLLPGLPPASPLAGTDVMLIGRPPPFGSPAGTPMIPYAVQMAVVAAAINAVGGLPAGGIASGTPGELPNVSITATGVDQVSAAVLIPNQVSIITGGGTDTGIRPPQGANASYPLFNALTIPQAMYPPLTVAGVPRTINGLSVVSILPGAELIIRTVDGISFFVAV